jgi:hypothetical protein
MAAAWCENQGRHPEGGFEVQGPARSAQFVDGRPGRSEPEPLAEALTADDFAERERRACDARQIEDLARDDAAP